MKLIVSLCPESGNAYDSLAEFYARSGDTLRAVENYRRALALGPANANAAQLMEALQEQAIRQAKTAPWPFEILPEFPYRR